MSSQPFRQLVPEFVRALNCEIDEAKLKGGDKYQAFDGEWLATGSDGHVYRFRLDRACFAPEECGVSIDTGGQADRRAVRGSIICVEGLDIVLRLEQPPDDRRLQQATMTVELWFILEKLRDRLRMSTNGLAKSGEKLFNRAGVLNEAAEPTGISAAAPRLLDGLNAEQQTAAWRGLQAGAHFIWGPPGTGKTRTVGHAAAAAASRGLRVLVVAYSNVALDVAALATAAAAKSDEDLRTLHGHAH